MYVIYKIVNGLYYYIRIYRRYGKVEIEWTGLINNATKFEDEDDASMKAESYHLNPEQIKKID